MRKQSQQLGIPKVNGRSQKKPDCFQPEKKHLRVKNAGEVLKTESIQQKCPLSLTAVIGIAVCIILVMAIVIMAVVKRRKRQ